MSACSSAINEPSATSAGVTTTTETEAPTVHIGQLTGSTSNLGSTWTADVKVKVVDASDQPVADAVVSGFWDLGDDADDTCRTDTQGECSLSSAPIRKNTKHATLTINSVEHAASTYIADDDYDPDSITGGTSIRIRKT